MDTVQTMLDACQIAGPALVDLHAWRWLYANPDADAPAFRDAVIGIATDLWDRFYAQYYGDDPYHILAAYQHMVAHPLYLPDYAGAASGANPFLLWPDGSGIVVGAGLFQYGKRSTPEELLGRPKSSQGEKYTVFCTRCPRQQQASSIP